MRALVIIVSCLLSSVAVADIAGRVVAITDGDTFALLTPGKQQVKVRLSEIDEVKGERWFCSEEEARGASWRPIRNQRAGYRATED